MSVPALVAIAFGLGVLTVLLQQRIEDLQDQNARLATKQNLEAVIRVPESEPVPTPPPPVDVVEEDKPASMW